MWHGISVITRRIVMQPLRVKLGVTDSRSVPQNQLRTNIEPLVVDSELTVNVPESLRYYSLHGFRSVMALTPIEYLKYENRAFWNTLCEHLLEQRNRISQKAAINLLNLACGPARETLALSNFFEGKNYEDNLDFHKIYSIGVDIDSQMIQSASNFFGELDNHEFICADGNSFLKGAKKKGVKFDVILLRSQNVNYYTQEVTTMCFNSIKALSQDGVFIVTSKTRWEHNFLCSELKNQGFFYELKVKRNRRNEHSSLERVRQIPFLEERLENDKYILVLERKS